MLNDSQLHRILVETQNVSPEVGEHIVTLVDALKQLRARDQEWWRAATNLLDADFDLAEDRKAWTALDNLKRGSGWTDVPEPVVKQLCDQRDAACTELAKLRAAIAKHHGQKADDRCIMDDDELYASVGLGPPDRRIGDPLVMLENCRRFIERRCVAGGPWPSYAELEARVATLEGLLNRARKYVVDGILGEQIDAAGANRLPKPEDSCDQRS